MLNPKIIATIGPGSRKPGILDKLQTRGVSFFRVNLSHTDLEEIEPIVKELKKRGIQIILDTEGSQIRSGNRTEIALREGNEIKIYAKEVECNENQIFFNPSDCVNHFKEGDLIFIDFNSVLLNVSDVSKLKSNGYISCKILIGGMFGGRKAVYVDSPTFKLPPFSDKDRKAVEIAKKYGIKHFTLSFMSCKEDVLEFKKMYPSATVYSKIESREGLNNFVEIAKASNGLLIDRGDLSHQVPLERIPLVQKKIIQECRKLGKEIFVATNTLEQMATSLKPNRAEVNDIVNTVLDGATGIALTKETAVGKYPVETVNMLKTIIEQLKFVGADVSENKVVKKLDKMDYVFSENLPGLLIAPHGGQLVKRFNPNLKISKLSSIEINDETLMDIEQIAFGAFSPIEGFMNKKDFTSVLDKMRLSDGTVWPLPINLFVDEKDKNRLKVGTDVALIGNDKETYGILHLEEIYKVDKKSAVEKIYGTSNLEHPGVKRFLEQGDFALSGKITLIKRRFSNYKVYELTPAQTRRIFSERGWSKVVGFHTRNVIHKSHEFIQMEGLKQSFADGLFVHPVIGKKKKGDFEAEAIIETYEKMINDIYPKDKVVLSTWASYSRYAGPREALFTALVRKNYGCSHFIIGRDHTGVGNFYSTTASQEIFDKFTEKELGIIPIKFGNVAYSEDKKGYVFDKGKSKSSKHISGTQAREMLVSGKMPPEWFMRPEISKIILDKIKSGKKVFVE